MAVGNEKGPQLQWPNYKSLTEGESRLCHRVANAHGTCVGVDSEVANVQLRQRFPYTMFFNGFGL
jgi:hypothetical protein